MDFFTLVALFTAGMIIGALDAVIGAGSLMMASLFTLLGYSPLHTIVTMRVASLVEEFSAAANFARKKLINWRQILIISLVAAAGSFFGANLVLEISEKILTYIVGILMLLLLFFLPKPEKKSKGLQFIGRLYTKLFCKDDHCVVKRNRHRVLAYIFSLLLGIYGGFYGAGVGLMFVAMFLIIGTADPIESSAASKVISFFMSLTASLVFINTGYIVLPIFIPISIGAVVGTFIGVEATEYVNRKISIWLLYIVITASAIKLIFFP